MEIRELEYFTVIARTRSLTQAARELYVGQPALSKFLQRLEQEWGQPMFSRCGHELRLTYAGERCLYYAEQILSTMRSLDNEMQDIRKSNLGVLHVGMPPVRCSIILPRVLPGFHEAFPNVEFQIIENNSEDLDAGLMGGIIDLAFYGLSMPKKELCYEVIEKDEIYVIVRKDHPVRERSLPAEGGIRAVSLEWLEDEVFLLQARKQRQGEYLRDLLERNHIHPVRTQEHSNIRAALSLAAGGYGIAFLAGSLLRHFVHMLDFDYYSISGIKTSLEFVAAYRNGAYLPAYARTFIDMVRNASH